MTRPQALIIGAGALGLGFLTERLAGAYDLCLADVHTKAGELGGVQAQQGYTANVCRLDGVEVRRVRGTFRTVVTDEPGGQAALSQALQEADLILTVTGRKLLDRLVPAIAPALHARTRRGWLLFCENGRNIAETFGPLLGPQVVAVDTVMGRMCRLADPEEQGYEPLWPGDAARLVVEEYPFLPLDAGLCAGGPFASSVFTLVSEADFRSWEDAKVYIHNGMHAFVSYHAHLEGIRRFPQAPAWIRAEAKRIVLEELVPALLWAHPGTLPDPLQSYGLSVLERIFNPYFNDSIERGVRGVAEKLAPGERLLGGVELIRQAGIEPRGYARTIEAARTILARQGG